MTKEETKKAEGGQSAKKDVKKKRTGGTQLGTRREIPSVAYLLAHGDPEKAHLPKTWMDLFGFPLFLSFVFFLSLLTFHYAPHTRSTHKGFKLPQRNQPLMDPVTVAEEPEKPIEEEL